MNEPLAPIRNAAIDALEKMGRLPSDDLILGDRTQATETY
jgi:hypothetical protein